MVSFSLLLLINLLQRWSSKRSVTLAVEDSSNGPHNFPKQYAKLLDSRRDRKADGLPSNDHSGKPNLFKISGNLGESSSGRNRFIEYASTDKALASQATHEPSGCAG